MIEVIFTLDYEIYGNGTGTLKQHVFDPAVQLVDVFRRRKARFVPFVEVAEFERIEERGTDGDIELVKQQIRQFDQEGFEIGLHLHPQWYRAQYESGRWLLDYADYNLCTLSRERIVGIVDRAVDYLRHVLNHRLTPLSFRAGNWLFQPTRTAAEVLGAKGFKIDSSVFKGGVQRNHRLDYRPALKNGYFWSFSHDANVFDPLGPWLEIPVYTEMVPFWRMLTAKRVQLQRKGTAAPMITAAAQPKWNRTRDFLRFRYPLKLDFCRMTLEELTSMTRRLIKEDRDDPSSLRPVVAIGHTKDLIDIETVDAFLSFLEAYQIRVSTFQDVYPRLQNRPVPVMRPEPMHAVTGL